MNAAEELTYEEIMDSVQILAGGASRALLVAMTALAEIDDERATVALADINAILSETSA